MAKPSLLGVCVIGAGRAGMIHARNFSFGRVPEAALVAVVEPAEPARQAARRELRLEQVYADYRQALADRRSTPSWWPRRASITARSWSRPRGPASTSSARSRWR